MTRRLVYLSNHAGYFVSHRLSHALAAREAGWDVRVICSPGPAQAAIHAAGIPMDPLDISRSGLRPDRELRSLRQIRGLLEERRPDLLHCISLKAVVLGGLAARLAKTPAVVHSISGLGHVFTEQTVAAWLLRGFFLTLLPLVVARHCRIIVQNAADLERLSRHGLGERSRLIRGAGVDLQRFQPSPEPEGTPTVIMASRLIRKKGVAEFVEAARILRSQGVAARFLLVGESDPGNPGAVPTAQLEAWNREGAVEWLGQRDDIDRLLAQSHIACLPSYYGEGVPKGLIEAAAAGRPVVTTAQPGCAEIVRDGENGLHVAPRDPMALAIGLRMLIEDPPLRARMGARAREIACEGYGLESVLQQTLAVYEELAGEAGLPDAAAGPSLEATGTSGASRD